MGNQYSPTNKRKNKPAKARTLAKVRAQQGKLTKKRGGQIGLDATMIPKIARAMTIGTQAQAAASVGATASGLKRWLSRGEQVDALDEGTAITEADHVCWQLYLEVSRANAEFIARHAGNIEDVATTPILHANGTVKTPGDWVASMTMLERRFPDLYGRRSVVAGPGPGGSHMLAIGNLDSVIAALDGGASPPPPEAPTKDADVIDVKPEPTPDSDGGG